MRAARENFARYLADERGATAVEYGLICALLVLAVIGGIAAVGSATSDNYNAVVDGFPT
jgi:pilus assembly protein Flp/PilA